jgi:hypothetical protein
MKFELTPREQKVLLCVLAALALGSLVSIARHGSILHWTKPAGSVK